MTKYPRTKSQDLLFKELFINSAYVSDNGGVVSGTPTILNGATRDMRLLNK